MSWKAQIATFAVPTQMSGVGATTTSSVIIVDVCSREIAKLTSMADIGAKPTGGNWAHSGLAASGCAEESD